MLVSSYFFSFGSLVVMLFCTYPKTDNFTGNHNLSTLERSRFLLMDLQSVAELWLEGRSETYFQAPYMDLVKLPDQHKAPYE